jgi:hypothetical protein
MSASSLAASGPPACAGDAAAFSPPAFGASPPLQEAAESRRARARAAVVFLMRLMVRSISISHLKILCESSVSSVSPW